MHVGMGLIKNEHGVWCARVKVKNHLQAAVARVSGKRGKSRQTFLKQSLRTKDKAEAKRRLPAVLMQFNETLKKAEALIAPEPSLPPRTSLSKAEIERLAQEMYAKTLGDDERFRFGGRKYHAEVYELAQHEAEQEGRELGPPMFPLESIPEHGWSREQLELQREHLLETLAWMQQALAMGDITAVQDHMMFLLDDNQINLDPQSDAYRELGRAVLRQYVRALQAIGQRNAGEPVETSAIPRSNARAPTEGGTLRAALDGWKKARRPSEGTLAEYQRAVEMFVNLHGDMMIADIKKKHARTFREALQDVPRTRSKGLQGLRLPELASYGREHPEVRKVTAKTVNKQFGGVQAVALWAANNGMIPEDVDWSDPFARMRLEEDEPDREPFTPAELRIIFGSPVYTKGERPEGGKGEASFWLPLLAALTGARLSDYAGLSVADIQTDEAAGVPVMVLREDVRRGRTLKTKSTARTLPLHPELIRIGFLCFVDSRRTEGEDAWLFPSIAPDTTGAAAWSKWFGRYLDVLGITDERKVFHSFRHNAKDALRAAGVQEDLNDAITGHAGRTVGSTYGTKRVLARYGMTRVVEAVASVRYPNLDLQRLHWGAGPKVGRSLASVRMVS
jgi:integrase